LHSTKYESNKFVLVLSVKAQGKFCVAVVVLLAALQSRCLLCRIVCHAASLLCSLGALLISVPAVQHSKTCISVLQACSSIPYINPEGLLLLFRSELIIINPLAPEFSFKF
jgi:predicted aconitase with swiveling domain